MLDDISMRCCTDTVRDISYVSRRLEHEGLSFLTISLSSFAKDLEKALDQGYIAPDMFKGFHQPNRHVAFPAFLSGLLVQVFQPTGELLDEPSIECIRCVRQFCLMWKKIHLPCTKERIDATFSRFVECDAEVATSPSDYVPNRLADFERCSEILWTRVLYRADETVRSGDLSPRHGRGATAERISGNRKYEFREWHQRLESAFPFTGYALASLSIDLEEALEDVHFREPEEERPVRVISVPKTLKSPRIIAIEPVCMQYTQQALLPLFYDSIERHELTRGHVNFTSQEINRELALIGSVDGSFATIDLSEASDRVSLVLVESMLKSSALEDLSAAVMATRSTRADVPGHGVIQLNKFASAGSALCFPIESMAFFTIALCAVRSALNLPWTYRGLFEASRHVWVYGDDIIVSTDKVPVVVDWLSSFNMKVNANKSFWTGKFRESCGMDAYDGEQVTPVYLTRMPPDNKRSSSEIMSFVSFANKLYNNGYWQTAKEVRKWIEAILGPLPTVLDTSPVLGWQSFCNSRFTFHRINMNLQRPELMGYVVSVGKDQDNLDGYPALLKYFLKRGEEPTFDVEHLTKSVLSARVNIKRRWSPAY